jgi:hypothetical protein
MELAMNVFLTRSTNVTTEVSRRYDEASLIESPPLN